KVHNWGKKRLAYDVQGHRDGIYVLIYFEADPSLIQTLARHYGLTEQIIKYMTVNFEDPPEIKAEVTTRVARDRDEDDEDE
ncbi:30S ribosomal protein S6, partial [Candidatus Poribacteria bacterium]